MQQVAANDQAQVGLQGYCPVCVVNLRKWVMGDPNHAVTYDGKTYFFPGDGPKKEFLRNPAKYTPALGGDCTICYAKVGKRVAGDIRFVSMHENRLYLFPSAKERNAFDRTPKQFEDTDLAFDGNCIVCQAKMNKTVKGNEEFTAFHDGFRYLFPSNRERQIFAQSPQQFVDAANKPMTKDSMHAHEGGMGKKSMKHGDSMMKRESMPMANAQQVQFRGQTACAGCEFGVKPLGAPEELGLAVTTSDGKVYVIEDGHSRWPQVYKQRFDGQQVDVSGTIVKTAGNVSWVKPNRLSTL